ncbi:MAG: Fe-S cluster assembly protein SufD [Bacteroidetes bacterium]|nr:Fe-S cluster assembly protein SufD [Bacteroidota bacterium]
MDTSQSQIQHYKNEFSAFEKNGASKSPAWVHDIRKAAIEIFEKEGFPTKKNEAWRFTNITPILHSQFRYSSAPSVPKVEKKSIEQLLLKETAQHLLVFVNGHFSKELSAVGKLPDGVLLTNLAEAVVSHQKIARRYLGKIAKTEQSVFSALNTAFTYDGLFVYVPRGVQIAEPIHALYLSSGAGEQVYVSAIRNLVIAEEESSLMIMENFLSLEENKNFTNAVTEIEAKKKSRVELVKVQHESAASFHYENVHVHQEETSNVALFSLAAGSALARNDMQVIIDGEAAECNLNGLYIVTGTQVVDHHTLMHHIHPNCPSHELFKGILDQDSRAIFNGRVYVEPEAQKTDSKQTNRNLLLSDNATVNTKPELEIFADDVKCTHGAAVGGLNDQMVFYLKSRGIGEETAKGMLVVGFAAEVTGKISNEKFRQYVDAVVIDYLQTKLGMKDLPEIVHS